MSVKFINKFLCISVSLMIVAISVYLAPLLIGYQLTNHIVCFSLNKTETIVPRRKKNEQMKIVLILFLSFGGYASLENQSHGGQEDIHVKLPSKSIMSGLQCISTMSANQNQSSHSQLLQTQVKGKNYQHSKMWQNIVLSWNLPACMQDALKNVARAATNPLIQVLSRHIENQSLQLDH